MTSGLAERAHEWPRDLASDVESRDTTGGCRWERVGLPQSEGRSPDSLRHLFPWVFAVGRAIVPALPPHPLIFFLCQLTLWSSQSEYFPSSEHLKHLITKFFDLGTIAAILIAEEKFLLHNFTFSPDFEHISPCQESRKWRVPMAWPHPDLLSLAFLLYIVFLFSPNLVTRF